MAEPKQLMGIVVPLMTPLTEGESIDNASLAGLVEHAIRGGVHGVFVMGTSGEFARMDEEQWRTAVNIVVATAGKRVPVYAGVSAPGARLAAGRAETAQELGADVLVATPPYYFPVSQREIEIFYRYLAAAVDLPLMLYDIPSTTHVSIEAETVLRLSEVEGIVGIKDSSGNWDHLQQLLQHLGKRDEFRIFVGEEAIMKRGLLAGAHGGVPASANLVPRLFSLLYQATKAGNLTEADTIEREFRGLDAYLKSLSDTPTSWLSVKKAALQVMGICHGRMSAPQQPLAEGTLTRIREAMERRGLLPAPLSTD
jgi:4-hydroxy-tetrahydrodipicolinate synthase